ncbi:MAG: DUF2461 domain-containing protein [Myxococcota bacterium]
MTHFRPETFAFLRELAAHNDRDWFGANKARYERYVKGVFAAFVVALAPRLAAVDPDARCDAKSLFRIHRDTRFSADKSPYKTHAGAHFPCGERGVHRPGWYLHVQPGQCFLGAGLWHPEPPTLARIRAAIHAQQPRWAEVKAAIPPMTGESLTRVPRGYDKDHPFADDLRRKDHTTGVTYDEAALCDPGFLDRFVGDCGRVRPLVRFLGDAVG